MGVSFGSGDGGDLHLLGLFDKVLGLLGLLLSHLLHLDGLSELATESEVSLKQNRLEKGRKKKHNFKFAFVREFTK